MGVRLGMWLLFFLFFGGAARASQILTVTAHGASVYDTPSDSGKTVFRARNGQRFKSDGDIQKGFFPIKTKLGKTVWIHRDDVLATGGVNSQPAKTSLPSPVKAPKHEEVKIEEPTQEDEKFKRWGVDLGASTSINNSGVAYELYVGVNYFIKRWLIFRNAPFYRGQSNAPSIFGLDTSLQGRHAVSVGPGILIHGLLGAGYRIANQGSSAPFGEIGGGLQKDRFGFSVSIKRIFHAFVKAGAADETLFSINIAGGMSF